MHADAVFFSLCSTWRHVTEPSETARKAGCYRLYRYSLRERAEWNELNERGLHWLIIRCVSPRPFGNSSLLNFPFICFAPVRSLARQPNNRQAEEVEQAISLIRTGMYLPPLGQLETPDENRLSERSSPTPDRQDMIDKGDLDDGFRSSPEGNARPGVNRSGSSDKVPSSRAEGRERERLLEQGLVRALIAIAENQEDIFQRVALETLAELGTYGCINRQDSSDLNISLSSSAVAVLDLQTVLEADAFRVLLQAIEQGPYDTSRTITSVLLQTLDSPLTREWLPIHSGIEVGITSSRGDIQALISRHYFPPVRSSYPGSQMPMGKERHTSRGLLLQHRMY